MTKPVVTFIFCLFTGYLAAQPIVKLWDHRFGGAANDVLKCVLALPDGYLLCGSSASAPGGDKLSPGKGGTDIWIVRTNTAGFLQWEKDLGGSQNDFLQAAVKTSDGGFLLGCLSYSDSSGDKTENSRNGSADFWIIKTDSAGSRIWDKTYGGSGDDQLNAIIETRDRGFLLAGTTFSGSSFDIAQPSFGLSDFWIVRTDSTGNKLWEQRYGGALSEELYAAMETTSGFVLAGSSISGISGQKTSAGYGGYDFWLLRTDSMGTLVSQSDIGGAGEDFARKICKSSAGYVVAGVSSSDSSGNKTSDNYDTTGTSYDFWIVTVDSMLQVTGDQAYGGTRNEDEPGSFIALHAGGYLLSGTSYSDAGGDKSENNLGTEQIWVVRTDAGLVKQWDKTVQSQCLADDETGVALAGDSGTFIFAGYTDAGISGDKSEDCRGAWDFWMLKYADTTWTYSGALCSSSDTTFCGKQCLDFTDLSTNNPTSWQWLFPGATPSSDTVQNPTGICYNSYGSFDVTLIACNAAGCDTLFLPGFINELQPPAVPVITLSSDTLYATAAYSYQWYFNSTVIPGATGPFYIFQQPGDYYVIVTDSNGCESSSSVITVTGIHDAGTQAAVQIIPVSGQLLLFRNVSAGATVSIYDSAGRRLFFGVPDGDQPLVRIPDARGVLTVAVQSRAGVDRQKLILPR